jgi:hypothetical protein
MNKVATISMLLIAVLGTSIVGNTINQAAKAQLDPISNLDKFTNNSLSKLKDISDKAAAPATNAAAPQNSTLLKEGMANIFEIYQMLAGKGQTDVMLKLNNIERILIQLMQ